MNTMELEAQKAWLAREILCMNSEVKLNDLWVVLKGYNPLAYQQEKSQKRDIGFLEGKAKVIFADDWEMTPEELNMV
ncbi:MAG: hypothetical protein FWG79_04830 [Bacteroidales bacterium]|nr:hypothetical protein [Bacteroidales bacterium]